MVTIKIVSGPHVGKERTLIDGEYEGRYIPPLRLLAQLAQLGSEWNIDLSQASQSEVAEWIAADLATRIARAILGGRIVEFMNVKYQASSPETASSLIHDLENRIVLSGYYVAVTRDDNQGVLIEIGQREHPLQ